MSRCVLEAVVGLGQDVLEVVVLRLDGPHGVVDGRADVGALRQLDQRREAGRLGQVEHAPGLIVRLADRAPPAACTRQFLRRRLELVVGIAQKDQPQHRDGVFRGFQLGIGPQLVRRIPQAGFDIVAVMIHGFSRETVLICYLTSVTRGGTSLRGVGFHAYSEVKSLSLDILLQQ